MVDAKPKPRARTTARREADTVARAENEVPLLLAHPLSPEQSERLGLPKEVHLPNDEVRVSKDNARAIINAGFAQVDPEDPVQVREALGLGDPEDEAVAAAKAAEGDPNVLVAGS